MIWPSDDGEEMTEAEARRIADERAMALLYPPAIEHDWTPPYRIKAMEMRLQMHRVVHNRISDLALLHGRSYDLDSPIMADGETGRDILTRLDNSIADYEAHARDIIDRRPK